MTFVRLCCRLYIVCFFMTIYKSRHKIGGIPRIVVKKIVGESKRKY